MPLDKAEMAAAQKLLTNFERDTDKASVIFLGSNITNATGCILVLKGNKEAQWLRTALIAQGVLTPNKEICEGF